MKKTLKYIVISAIIALFAVCISVSASAVSFGDVNGSGACDSDDAIFLLRYSLDPENHLINQCDDFDNNGICDSDDAIFLLRYSIDPQSVGFKLFALDAGHGGNDPGAIGRLDRHEADDTGKVTDEVERILLEQGQLVFLIDRNLAVSQRPLQANSAGADFLISLHRDSSTNGNMNGFTIYTHNPTHEEQWREPNKQFAPAEQPDKHTLDDALIYNIEAELAATGTLKDRGVRYGSAGTPTYQDYYINRISNMPSCIVEIGFVSNWDDNYLFDTYYKLYAKCIAKALIKTAGGVFNENRYTQ